MSQEATERLAAALERNDDSEARQIYEQEVLPLEQARLKAKGTPADVLILTAGTQPYSLALSLAATPARSIYFLHTDRSLADSTRAVTLAGLDPAQHVHRREVRFNDPVGVYSAIRDILRLHEGESVVINYTSGTKAMTSGASQLATHLGLPALYVTGTEVGRPRERPSRQYFHEQRLHWSANPFEVFGDVERAKAEAAFDQGDFGLAGAMFSRLSDARAPDYHFGARALLCEAYQGWSSLDFGTAHARLIEAVSALHRAPRHNAKDEPLYGLLPRLQQQARAAGLLRDAVGGDTPAPGDSVLSNALTRYLLARADAIRKRQPDLAVLLLYRALELSIQRRLAVHGIDASDPDYTGHEGLLDRYNELVPEQHRLARLPDRITLAAGRSLLEALGDEAIARVQVNSESFSNLLSTRNQSVYAHGFVTLSPGAASTFRKTVLKFAKAVARADGHEIPVGLVGDPEYDLLRFASEGRSR